MKRDTFSPISMRQSFGSRSGLQLRNGFFYLIAFCAIAASACAGDVSKGHVAPRKKWNGVTIGRSVYDTRTRDFQKPWPFGQAAGAGGNSN
jgi:hypothetical protein